MRRKFTAIDYISWLTYMSFHRRSLQKKGRFILRFPVERLGYG